MVRAMYLKEPAIIFDCGFCHEMAKHEIQNTAKQLTHSFSQNRDHSRPFDIHFCNFENGSLLHNYLLTYMKNAHRLPIKLHETDLMEIFPAEQLIYLTPESENELTNIPLNVNFIVGAIVDKAESKPLTLSKAKRLGIKTARLPLDRYLKFRSHKSLTIDQVTRILLDFKKTGDWKFAFKHIPQRKYF